MITDQQSQSLDLEKFRKRRERVLVALEAFGRRYVEELLRPSWDRERLERDWYYAFKFLLWHLYLQGRRDEVSLAFYSAVVAHLDRHLEPDIDERFERAWASKHIPHDRAWSPGVFVSTPNPLYEGFTRAMGKDRDHEMTLDALRFVHALDGRNVVRHSLREIDAGRAAQHRWALQGVAGGIWQCGPKTSAFYLRDVCFLFGRTLPPEAGAAIQPVDVWVRRVVGHVIGQGEHFAGGDWLARAGGRRFDPALLNAGAWYLGKHAFYFLLALLADAEVDVERIAAMPVWQAGDDDPAAG